MAPITDWWEAIYTSAAGALALLFTAIPRLIGFALIVLIGWFIAGQIAKAVSALLRTVRFNDLAKRAGMTGFIQQMGLRTAPSDVLANLAKWFVRLIALVVAFDALGLPAVSQVLQQFLLWLPNLLVALLILVVAGLAAGALSNLVRGATASASVGNPDLLGTIAGAAIWGFGIVVAVNQIGVAETLVNTLFIGLVGALGLALGLAFGLGGRETAAEIVRGWYQQGREAKPKIERATRDAGRQAMDDQQALKRMLEPGTSAE